MAVPKGGFKITIDDGFEKINKYYNVQVKGLSIKLIDDLLKTVFSGKDQFIEYCKYKKLQSENYELQKQIDFKNGVLLLTENRVESLQKRLEEKENKLIGSETLTELYNKHNSNLLSENERLDKLTKQTLNKSIADKEEILKLLKENELLKGEKSNYIEYNLQLQKNLQTQKEISKSNAESWDEMYHKLNGRKTLKQQFYSSSDFIFLLAIASAIIGLFMPVFIPWLKASVSLMGLSYIAQNKSFINLFYKK